MNKMIVETLFARGDKVFLKKDFIYLKGKYHLIDKEGGVKRSWTCIELVLCVTRSGHQVELWNLQSNDIYKSGVLAEDLIPYSEIGE